MPVEKFYAQGTVFTRDGDDRPVLTVSWGGEDAPEVQVNESVFDRSAVNRLIRALRRARDATFGADE